MASRGINKMILVGNLGNDPEIRYMPNGGAVANITVATSESWKDKQSGEQRESVEWHRVVLFGKVAEIAGEYLKKGSQVYIEGQLKTRKWEKDGVERYSTEIVVNVGGTMQMIGKAPEGGSGGGNRSSSNAGWGQPQQPQHSGQQGGQQRQQQRQQQAPQKDFDEEIPFAPIGLQYGKSKVYAL